eukprot:4755528-Pyramimonas_sp.AAC.1
MKIIAEEVLGYNTDVAPDFGSSTHAVYALGNCQPFTQDCSETEKERDPEGTVLSRHHVTFEIWENYPRGCAF